MSVCICVCGWLQNYVAYDKRQSRYRRDSLLCCCSSRGSACGVGAQRRIQQSLVHIDETGQLLIGDMVSL